MSYADAKDSCSVGSAKLYDDFNGSEQTVTFLCTHMHPETVFWLGLSDKYSESIWLTDNDQSMNNYLPVERIQDTADDQDFLALDCNYGTGNDRSAKFVPTVETESLAFVCFKIEIDSEF